MYEIGTKLRYKDRCNDFDLTLIDAQCITEPGSCGADEWLFHWEDEEGLPFKTLDEELEGMLADRAILIPPSK